MIIHSHTSMAVFVIDDFTAILKRKLALLTIMMCAFVLFACQPLVHHSGRVGLRSPFPLGLLAIAAGPDLPRPLAPLLLGCFGVTHLFTYESFDALRCDVVGLMVVLSRKNDGGPVTWHHGSVCASNCTFAPSFLAWVTCDTLGTLGMSSHYSPSFLNQALCDALVA